MTDQTIVRAWSKTTLPFAECVNPNCPTPGPELLMTVYVPTVMNQGISMPEKFPLMLMLTGGGFINGDHEMSQWPEQYVKRGMTVATIDYRLGWDVDGDGDIDDDDTHSQSPGSCVGDYPTLLRAIVRAKLDGDRAVRYLLGDSTTYHIDKDAIFCGGPSAGGALAVHLGYARPGELEAYWQDLYGNDPALVENPCDMRFAPIPCQPPTGSAGYYMGEYSFKGVMNCWGGLSGEYLMDPHNGPDPNDTIPDNAALIAFYGGFDHIFPPYIGTSYECPNYPDGYGSAKMFELRRKYNYPSQLYMDPDALHKYVWLDPSINVGSDASANRLARAQFIVSRSCCFFKSVMCGVPCSYDAPMVMDDISDWSSAYYNVFGTAKGEPIGCNNDGSMRYRSITTGTNVYPNPSNGRVRVVGAGFENGGNYTLFDCSGRVLQVASFRHEDQPIDLTAFPDGFYILRLNDDTHEFTARVILQRWTY